VAPRGGAGLVSRVVSFQGGAPTTEAADGDAGAASCFSVWESASSSGTIVHRLIKIDSKRISSIGPSQATSIQQ